MKRLITLANLFDKMANRENRRAIQPAWQQRQEFQDQLVPQSSQPAKLESDQWDMDNFDFGASPEPAIAAEPLYENINTQGGPPSAPPFSGAIQSGQPFEGLDITPVREERTERPKKKKREKEKTPAQLADEYWADKAEKNPINIKEWHEQIANLDQKKKDEKEPAMPEDEAFEQADERLQEIESEIKRLIESIDGKRLSMLMDEREASSYSKKMRTQGMGGEIKEVRFERNEYTPDGKPFSKWVLIKPGTGGEVVSVLQDVYKLKANYNNIRGSKRSRKGRESVAKSDRLDKMLEQLENAQRGQSRVSPNPELKEEIKPNERREMYKRKFEEGGAKKSHTNRFEVFYK